MISMPKVQDIRKMARAGCSVAEISRETGVSEPTVRKYIRKTDFSPTVPAKKKASSILDEHKPVVDMWIEEDRRSWHKQRHTATRIYERLVSERGFKGSYSTVQRYVKDYKAAHKDQRDEHLDLECVFVKSLLSAGKAYDISNKVSVVELGGAISVAIETIHRSHAEFGDNRRTGEALSNRIQANRVSGVSGICKRELSRHRFEIASPSRWLHGRENMRQTPET